MTIDDMPESVGTHEGPDEWPVNPRTAKCAACGYELWMKDPPETPCPLCGSTRRFGTGSDGQRYVTSGSVTAKGIEERRAWLRESREIDALRRAKESGEIPLTDEERATRRLGGVILLTADDIKRMDVAAERQEVARRMRDPGRPSEQSSTVGVSRRAWMDEWLLRRFGEEDLRTLADDEFDAADLEAKRAWYAAEGKRLDDLEVAEARAERQQREQVRLTDTSARPQAAARAQPDHDDKHLGSGGPPWYWVLAFALGVYVLWSFLYANIPACLGSSPGEPHD